MKAGDVPCILSLAAGKSYGGRPPQGSSAVDALKARCVTSLLRGGHSARRVLGRHTDDLDPGSASDVHRFHDIAVLHLGITLHEDDLLRAWIVDLLEPGPEARAIYFLG